MYNMYESHTFEVWSEAQQSRQTWCLLRVTYILYTS